MAYSVDTIVQDVLVAIDENRVAEDALSTSTDVDTLEMNDIIKSKIADGINSVLMIAPVETLGPVIKSSEPTVTRDTDTGNGTVDIPNMLRLITIKVASWKRPVTKITVPGTQSYMQQFSEFAGVKGHASKPVVIPSDNALTENTKIEYKLISVATTDAKATVRYVEQAQEPSTTVTGYDLPAVLYRASVYKIAALTCANYENTNMLQLFNSLCLEQLGLTSQQAQS